MDVRAHLEAALKGLAGLAVQEHLLPGVEVKTPYWHYQRQGLSVHVVLDPNVWGTDRDALEASGVLSRRWMQEPNTGRIWTDATCGRRRYGRDLTDEERATPRTDAEMVAEVSQHLGDILVPLMRAHAERLVREFAVGTVAAL
jgi:hypothetical protein